MELYEGKQYFIPSDVEPFYISRSYGLNRYLDKQVEVFYPNKYQAIYASIKDKLQK